ncbi:MAG: methyltransferase domain-containing protein [Mastigocoleus sp.]
MKISFRGLFKVPVYFQSIEKELSPVFKYVDGKLLNAGCGERDISDFLVKNGATEVDNCDIASSIPNAIICDLTEIPKEENTYDSILCNAVLEHVQFPDLVIKELHRILKPGGNLILCVPFLQPYHPCPTDFWRYTKDGLSELARLNNLEVIEILPVHSIAQTIGWIIWAYLLETKNLLLKLILWLPLYIWTRLSSKTDFSLIKHASAYQIILRKRESHQKTE